MQRWISVLFLSCMKPHKPVIRQAVVRQSSGSRQAVVRQSSGSRQAVVRQSSGSRRFFSFSTFQIGISVGEADGMGNFQESDDFS